MVCNVKPANRKSWAENLLVSDLTFDTPTPTSLQGQTRTAKLGPLLQGQTRIAKLKSAYNSLIIGIMVCNVKPTFRKSWAGNLLMW